MAETPRDPFDADRRDGSPLAPIVLSPSSAPSDGHPSPGDDPVAEQPAERVWVGGVGGGRNLSPFQRLWVGLLAIVVITLMLVIIVPLGLIAVLIFLSLTAMAMIRATIAEFIGRLTGTRDGDSPPSAGRRNVRVRAPGSTDGGDA